MGSQKVKTDKAEPASAPEAGPVKEVPKGPAMKKWKGKEWFSVKAPKMFENRVIGDIPATDPQSLVGRNIVATMAELGGNPNSYFLKFRFKITSVEGKEADSRFNGMDVMKERIYRIVRKGTSRVEIITDIETNDKWVLHVKTLVILNRLSDYEIQKKVRLKVVKMLKDLAVNSSLEDFVKAVSDDLVQKNIKKYCSPIYPIRFCVVAKIGVKKPGK